MSSIQSLFESFKSDNGSSILTLDLIEIARWYTKDKLELEEVLSATAKEHAAATFTVKGLAPVWLRQILPGNSLHTIHGEEAAIILSPDKRLRAGSIDESGQPFRPVRVAFNLCHD